MSNVSTAGTWHTMADGSKLSYSLVNNTAPDFSIPRQYSVDKLFALGQGQAPPAGLEYSPAACHFMSLCMKLVYEKKDVIQVHPASDTMNCLALEPQYLGRSCHRVCL